MSEPVAPPIVRPAFGVFCILAAALVASAIGLLVRLIEAAEPSQIVFWRSVGMFLGMGMLLVWRHGFALPARLAAVGWLGACAAVGMAGAMTFAIWAFVHTTVANVLFVVGAVPFVTSLLAWALLGERLSRASWAAIAASFLGIAVMTAGGLASGRWLGDVLALGAMLSYAVFVIAIRAGRALDMMPVLALGAALAALIGGLGSSSLAIGGRDLAICLVLGAGISVVAYILITIASRHIRAGELSLLGTVEIVLGPLWVWLAVDELPTTASFVGGAVILAAVVAQGVAAIRQERG